MDQDPEELTGSGPTRQSESDRPPVGEPLVVSRRNPAARPAGADPPVEQSRSSAADAAEGVAAEGAGDERRQLDGRVALVTGAAGELGTALAWELVDRGAKVLLVDHDLADLLDLTDALSVGRAIPLRCDLGSDVDVAAACDFVARSATVDVVVHVGDDRAMAPELAVDARTELDDRYRVQLRGPLALVDGLSSTLGPAPKVLLVERDDADRDALSAAAPDVLREQLSDAAGLQVSSAVCGIGLDPDVFAGAVVDLLVRDDLALGVVTLDAPDHGTGVEAAEAPTEGGSANDGDVDTGR